MRQTTTALYKRKKMRKPHTKSHNSPTNPHNVEKGIASEEFAVNSANVQNGIENLKNIVNKNRFKTNKHHRN